MTDKTVRIDETEFTVSSDSPFEFKGVHSGGNLSGIDLNITVHTDIEIRQIKELLKKGTVTVADPFADRQYEATLVKRSSSYQEGRPERRFHFEVKELDRAKQFKLLEIEGHRFHVLQNVEDLYDGKIGMHILLRLSPDEFLQFRGLLKLDSVEIQRIGIDENSIIRRFGGAQYWSSHNEGSQEFYKHIVRLYPIDLPGSRVSIASGHAQIAQEKIILALSARYDALVKILTESGQITQENSMALMAEEWQSLIDDEREVLLRSKLREVQDAELELH